MASFKFVGLIAAVVFLSAFTVNTTIPWTIDEDHSIQFSTKKAKGDFEKFDGDIQFDGNNLQNSRFDVKVDVMSIRTGNWLKNRHARGDNWFDAEKYPTINFTSESFAKTATGYEVTGTLELHGIQKKVTIPFTFTDAVFKSSFTVKRTDFKVGATTGMSGSVGDEIVLDIAVPVSR